MLAGLGLDEKRAEGVGLATIGLKELVAGAGAGEERAPAANSSATRA